jgi:aldehyde dehydrogenase (NAD+)
MSLISHDELKAKTVEILGRLGVENAFNATGDLVSRSPITGGELGRIASHTPEQVTDIVGRAQAAFERWRLIPAPIRGKLVRELGELLREHKDDLGALVSIEAGKITSEGLGEVQEMIDICDLGVGLSRQLYGQTIATERPGHRMMEQFPGRGLVLEYRPRSRLR